MNCAFGEPLQVDALRAEAFGEAVSGSAAS